MASVTRVASMTETRDTTGGEGLVPRRAPEAAPRRGLDRDTLQAIYDCAARRYDRQHAGGVSFVCEERRRKKRRYSAAEQPVATRGS